jgi:transposase
MTHCSWVGIDLHRSRSQVAVLDDQGNELVSRLIANDPETFLELLAEIDGESKIALEATYGWEWLADVLQDAGYELHLSHPLRTKAIAAARVKNDAVDARTLAHLLRAGLLPEAYIAPRELRELRDLLRHRVALTRMRAALKNRAGSVLAKYGVRRPFADMFGPGGLRFLDALQLPESPRRRLDSTLSLIADITRFDTARQLCSWAGMTPTVRSSDMRTRLGHISHQGSPAAALGARRGRSARSARRRSAARDLRADLKARQPGRQGRGRAQDPHALLLRPARRRDPLPGAAGRRTRGQNAGGQLVTCHGAHALHGPAVDGSSGELVFVNGLSSPGVGD